MSKFTLFTLILINSLSYIFAQHHHINRRGIQILGSYGHVSKNASAQLLNNRFGEDALKTPHKPIQIRGSYGGTPSKNVDLFNRFSESNETENRYHPGSGCVKPPVPVPGIGCKSLSLNEILESAGLSGGDDEGYQVGLNVAESGFNNSDIQIQISATYLPPPGSPNKGDQAEVSGILIAPYP